jgi:hypothetical protein
MRQDKKTDKHGDMERLGTLGRELRTATGKNRLRSCDADTFANATKSGDRYCSRSDNQNASNVDVSSLLIVRHTPKPSTMPS